MRKTDIIVSIILLGLSIATLLEIKQLPIGNLTLPQPGFFPLILAILLGILSLVLLGQAVKGTERRKERATFGGAPEGRKGT